MKTKVVVGSAIFVLVCCSVAVGQWPQYTMSGDHIWEFEAGTRILDRPGSELGIPLVRDALTLQTLFDDSDATDLNASAGVDARIMRRDSYGTYHEFKGFFNRWDVSQSVEGNLESNLLFGVPLSQVDYAYTSDVYSLEYNRRRAVLPGLHLMIGPRFFYMDEFVRNDSTIPNGFAPGIDSVVRVDSSAKNPAIGLQIGAELRKPIAQDMFLIGFIKAGMYGNATRATLTVDTIVLNNTLTSTTITDQRSSHAAGLFEVGGRYHYEIVPGVVSAYIGYEATWFDGAALAPAQILSGATPAGPVLDHNSTPFFGGLVLGGTIRR